MDHRQGLPVVYRGGAIALQSKLVFWGKDWAWARPQTQFRVLAPYDYSVTGRADPLDLDLFGRIRKSSDRELTWEFELNARGATQDAIGGGIAFKFDLAAFGPELGEPELLPGNRGWVWGPARGSRIELRFDRPLALVHFEKGKKSEVRAYLYKDSVPKGSRLYVATLRVSGDVALVPSTPERFGLEDPAAWPTANLDWNASPVDLSFLNAPERPAGKRGFLKSRKDRLVFEDGTVARFWGTNLTARGLFQTTAGNAKQQAQRLSKLGFNLVRIHHHDSHWVDPNVFGGKNTQDTQNLDAAMMERLDWWIKCLEDEGVYIWLDLHVGRHLKAGDGIEHFEEIRKGKPTAELRGYNYVNASIQRSMKRFNEAYVGHRNQYTGLRYKDDPAIVAMLITNENDMTQHFGNALLPGKNVPWHSGLYMAQAEAFAAKHGLPQDKTWRSWEPGPAKLFLNDLEQRFDADMIGHLRGHGVRVPIAATSTWGSSPLSSLPALTTGNIIDVHAYGGTGELEKDPRYAPNLVSWIAAAQVAGKPLSVSEWNVSPFPVPDRHAIPLYVAGHASLHGWAAVMQFAYTQVALNAPGGPSNWRAFNDPALLATLPAAALLYRRGDVRESSTVYAFAPSREQLFYENISPKNAVALRSAAEKGKLVVVMPRTRELPWLEPGIVPSGANVLTDPSKSLLGADATEVVSDTGELRRDWTDGISTIDTPMTQAAMGWIGGRKIVLNDVEIAAAARSATVAVQSLDAKPIRRSGRIMISLAARSVPMSESRMPFHSEPVGGQLIIRAPKGLRLYAGPPGERVAISAPYAGGRYRIALDRVPGVHWLALE